MAVPDDWRVLVPVEILEGESLSGGVVDLLSPVHVVLLGYHVLPDQTAPGQARIQFEDRAQAALGDVREEIEDAGGSVETRLVFTHDAEETFDRVAAETGCGAVLRPNPAAGVDRLLVPLWSAVNVPRIAALVAALVADRDVAVTLYHAARSEDAGDEAREMLTDASDAFVAAGVPASALDTEVTVADAPLDAIVTAAADYDAVVMGESEPSLETLVFGELSERIADQSIAPVVVVTGVTPTDDDSEPEADSEPEDDAESE